MLTNTRIELGPITTFVCTNPVGQTIAEVDVPQYSFLEETVTSLPVIFYQAIGQKVCYDFRHLIGVNIRKDGECSPVSPPLSECLWRVETTIASSDSSLCVESGPSKRSLKVKC